MPTLETVRSVKARAEDQLMRMPGVTGVGVAYKYVGGRRTNELSIRVHVERKRDVPLAEAIPSEIEGVKTDVVERRMRPLSTIVSPLAEPLVDTGRYDPLKGGVSIGPCRDLAGNVVAGTLGVIVTDQISGAAMILSNFHVLALDHNFTVGENIVQPAIPDGGACPADVVGTLERATLGGQVDAAVARITARGQSCSVQDIGNVNGIGSAALDMPVRKRGRTTGLTMGFVDSIDLTTTVPYDGIGSVTFTQQIEIQADPLTVTVEPGLFIPETWSTAPLSTVGPVTVERSTTGGFPGIRVTGPTGSLFHVTHGISRYMVFGGDNTVLILESTIAAGPVTHWVTLIDFTTTPPTVQQILTGLASSATVSTPIVQYSQGSGSAFMIYSSNGSNIQNLAIHRSSNGTVLCKGPPPFVPTGETRGEASGSNLIIHYSAGGMSRHVSCPLTPSRGIDLPGDSGSVIVDDNRRVVGLLFAGQEGEGGSTIANPIQAVLDSLQVQLCTSGGGGSSGGGGGGGGRPQRTTLSVLALAGQCLGRIPPLSLRRDIFNNSNAAMLSLKTRLLTIHASC